RAVGKRLARVLPASMARALIVAFAERDPQTVIGATARFVKARASDLDRMPFDLGTKGPLRFEHLAGLFASTTLDESVISMNIRQCAYLFGLVREMAPSRVIEIGRYKGGSTLLLVAAMRVGGAVLFDDCFDDGFFRVPHTEGVGRAVAEIEAGGDFRLVKRVCRLAHLERVR